ncbi:hypothetical protein BDY21DRAFT_287042 [Lineolata rhizophorae]|uniref:Glycosyltransferase family 25 protein n=1 Tax=Lineolata rhizophorae TaxID=578093 RepID=A0A6A6NYW1_9PEZI|nr:hypothetical protein BDY21DRAFT_287042 [Lineolata rhizophorae]
MPSTLHNGLAGLKKPANATLGFGAVLAISGENSPRREGLLQAANVSEIDLTILKQPRWTDKDVSDFRDPDESSISKGSILAWLAHRHALSWFVEQTSLETVLILEDDVDFDARLRSTQIPLAAATFRSIFQDYDVDDRYYYGDPSRWDLLYLGHCGDYWKPVSQGIGVGHHLPRDLAGVPHAIFEDPTVLPRYYMHPYTASLLTAFGVPDRRRLAHASKFPLCTFGYAVTRPAAKRILDELALPHEPKAGEDGPRAFDVAILHGCNSGGLHCWTLTPELFHHMEGDSLIANADPALASQIYRPPVDAAGLDQVMARNETSNIGCGFWNKELWWGDDHGRLEWLRDMARSGECWKETGLRG